MHQGNRYDIVEVERIIVGDFLLLENANKEKGITRTIFLVTPNKEKNTFRLGRGHESDIRITDISVSRFHAHLKCTKKGFIIEDNNSKFGTLLLEPNPIKLEPEVKRVVQVGRTIMQIIENHAKVIPLPSTPAIVQKAKKEKPSSQQVHNANSEGGKASPSNGDDNQMEEIPDEDENLV